MYVIKRPGVKDHILNIEKHLLDIEVKGLSVDHLYIARFKLKELFEAIEEIDKEEKDEVKKEG